MVPFRLDMAKEKQLIKHNYIIYIIYILYVSINYDHIILQRYTLHSFW